MIKKNKYKIIIICTVLIGTIFAAQLNKQPKDPFISKLFSCINATRKAAGIKSLKYGGELEVAAQAKAFDMEKYNYFAHTDDKTNHAAWDFLPENKKNSLVAENLSKGYRTTTEVCGAWRKSKTHREQILNPKLKYTGIFRTENDIVVQFLSN